MSDHDFEREPTTAQHDRVAEVKGAPEPAKAEVRRPASAETLKQAKAIVEGRAKDIDDLPRLVSLLGHEDKVTFMTDHWSTLGERVAGDVVIATGEVLGYSVPEILDVALATKQPPTKSTLRRLLAKLTAGDAADLGEQTVGKLRDLMKGPLLDELPVVATWLWAFSRAKAWLSWFVETTKPAIVAFKLGQSGSADLATTLESLTTANKWAWVDHVHLAQGFDGLRAIASGAPDSIRQKLEAKLGPIADEKHAEQFRKQHANDVA